MIKYDNNFRSSRSVEFNRGYFLFGLQKPQGNQVAMLIKKLVDKDPTLNVDNSKQGVAKVLRQKYVKAKIVFFLHVSNSILCACCSFEATLLCSEG